MRWSSGVRRDWPEERLFVRTHALPCTCMRVCVMGGVRVCLCLCLCFCGVVWCGVVWCGEVWLL